MNNNLWLNRMGLLGILFSITIISCNKDVDSPVANDKPAPSGKSIGKILSENSSYSLLLAIANKVGLAAPLSDSSKTFTLFAPDNNAIKQFVSIYTNGAVSPSFPDTEFLNIISSASPGLTDTLRGIVNYHIIPGQAIKAAAISDTFPSTQMPTGVIVPPPANTNPLVRLTSFISRRGSSAWVNNIPVSAADFAIASNGVIHGIPAVLLPPSGNLWQTIIADPQLSYLKAAIDKADSSALSKDSLGAALRNFGLNATVFAPTDDAFENFILEALKSRGVPAPIAQGIIDDNGTNIISNPGSVTSDLVPNIGAALASVITARNVKGIIVYHVISSKNPPHTPPGLRYFSVNFPTISTLSKTLLNSDTAAPLRNHPGIALAATFAGPGVTAATVKGLVNSSAANIIVSPPPSNTHDLHRLNGVIHKIDQVLLPSPL